MWGTLKEKNTHRNILFFDNHVEMHRHVVVSSFLSDRDGDAGLVGARENVAIVGVQSIHFLAEFRGSGLRCNQEG